MDKRDRSTLFRTRLLESLQRTGTSRSQLARACGADRSTIGQLLSEAEPRLPNAHLAAEIAETLGVSCDWLLGLTDRPERPGDLLASAVAMPRATRSPADEKIMDWHREARGYKIRHVPATLPDLLRTPEMLCWEYTDRQSKSAEQALNFQKEMADFLIESPTDYEFALPLHELTALAEGSGYYSGLTRDIRAGQLAHIASECAEKFPSIRLSLFDARKIYSAPVTIFGPLLGVIYVGQFYLAFRSAERIRSLTRHFDELVREAEVDARAVGRYVAGLKVV